MTAVPTISGYCGGRHRLPQHLRREARDPGTRRRAATRRRFRGRFGDGQSRGRVVATRSATTSAHGRPRRIRAHLKVNYGAWGAPGASWTGTGSVPSPAGLCLNGNLPPSVLHDRHCAAFWRRAAMGWPSLRARRSANMQNCATIPAAARAARTRVRHMRRRDAHTTAWRLERGGRVGGKGRAAPSRPL